MKKPIAMLAAALMTFAAQATEQNRIISAGSTVTELIYALDAQDQLVAVDLTSRGLVAGSDIPQVGYQRQLSAEGLMSLAPTMLIGSREMGPDTTLSTLTQAGVSVETVSSGLDLDGLKQRIDEVAVLVGKEDAAETLKNDVVARMHKVQDTEIAKPPRVLFMMILEGRPITVAGNTTPVDSVIRLAGGVNPASQQFSSYKTMATEAILDMQPDVILIAQRAWDSLGGIDGVLEKQPLLAATPAGENRAIIPIQSSAILGGFGLQSLALAEELQQQFIQAVGNQ